MKRDPTQTTNHPEKRHKPHLSDIKSFEKTWNRNNTIIENTPNKPFYFQLIDIDYYTENYEPIIRMYGINESGQSLVAFIDHFYPYLYVELPENILFPKHEDIISFTSILENNLKKDTKTSQKIIQKVEIVKKSSIRQYNFGKQTYFIRIFLLFPNLIQTTKRLLESDTFQIGGLMTYESNLPYVLRFMIDKDIRGGGWIEIRSNKYNYLSNYQKKSRCQIEIKTHYENVVPRNELIERWIKIAPLRILSFDIECAGRKGCFPEAKIDKVIQIANQITLQGSDKPIVRNIFCLNSCHKIVGSNVFSFDSESELLLEWSNFVRNSDPDILTGYNIINFDLPYLLDRASILNIEKFPFLGRIKDCQTKMKDATFNSKAYGKRETKDIKIEGRIQFDLLPIIRREYKLRSYTLNAVSAHFLKQQKEDVHYSIITDLFNGTAETRRRLALYCIKDAVLPQRLLDKLMFIVNYVEMARVTGVPISYLLTRGQQIKVISQLYRKANSKHFIIPVSKRNQASEDQYTGATVLEPKIGYYTEPIATLDFTSLYPSIMIAHNLCYTTLVSSKEAKEKLDSEQYLITPNGDCFVNEKLQKGLLPEILEELIMARKRAKTDLKNATDPFLKAVLNGRQLALKISANSVYGFTGATVGSLPCLSISSSVTSFGRQMIDQTKRKVESEFCLANGYKFDSEVIYGDTDSVMVKFGCQDVASSMDLGKKAAKIVTEMFKKPISLEFEKVYKPYLLMNKKRYAGMLWTEPNRFSHMDAKGIETVRRDNCALVKDLVQNCLNKLLIDADTNAAIDYAKMVISKLLNNRIDLSQLVISKSLGKSLDSKEYKAKLAHVELAKRMAIRNPGSAPSVGDRVAYVIIQGAKGAPQYEKAEDPIYVLEKGLPIDTTHYLEHQLKLPLERIFSPIIGDVNKLLSGDHTRSIKISTPVGGALMKFMVVSEKCKGCKNVLKKNEKVVCVYCKPKISEIYIKHLRKLRLREHRFADLWVQCQRCQDNLHQDVICSNRDCPIFYRRTKAAKDLEEIQNLMNKFFI